MCYCSHTTRREEMEKVHCNEAHHRIGGEHAQAYPVMKHAAKTLGNTLWDPQKRPICFQYKIEKNEKFTPRDKKINIFRRRLERFALTTLGPERIPQVSLFSSHFFFSKWFCSKALQGKRRKGAGTTLFRECVESSVIIKKLCIRMTGVCYDFLQKLPKVFPFQFKICQKLSLSLPSKKQAGPLIFSKQSVSPLCIHLVQSAISSSILSVSNYSAFFIANCLQRKQCYIM